MVCHNCEEMLRDWTKGKQKGLPFGVPVVWRETREHVTNCSFCMANTKCSEKKIGIRSPIQAFPQPFDLFHIV